MIDHGWITIRGNVPSKSNSYRIITFNGKHKLGKSTALLVYERAFFMQSGKYRDLRIKGLFEFYCRVYYNSLRPDLDNSLKVQLDCLQYCRAIENDNKCIKVEAAKFIDKKDPRVEIRIVEI